MARSGALAPFFLGTFARNANKSDRHISMIISRGDWKLFPLHNTLANDAAEKASAEEKLFGEDLVQRLFNW